MTRLAAMLLAAAAGAACATAPVVVAPTVTPYEQKMRWILTLEDQRQLRAPGAGEPSLPPAIASARGRTAVAPVPPRPPEPDLLTLLGDPEARIRRRAALAVGRVGLPDGVDDLVRLLAGDEEPEVRQMAAFALGLIGDRAATPALTAALADTEPLVQGRAAEALGRVGDAAAAMPIAGMMAAHVTAGALDGLAADDLRWPAPAAAEAVRLGAFALVRLNHYDGLASALLDSSGMPVSRWWPVAWAFQRVGDPKAATVLQWLLQGDGQIGRAYAARGLGALKDASALPALTAIAGNAGDPVPVRVEAVRALAALGDARGAPPLTRLLTQPKEDANLRLEALTALARLRVPDAVDLYVDLLVDPWPALRAGALAALAATDPDLLLTALSGLDPDSDWQVRAALARALGDLDAARARPRLDVLLQDADRRVVAAALGTLARLRAPDAVSVLTATLEADDFGLRLAAANGLAALKAPAAAPALAKAYDVSAEFDTTYVARAAILAALAAVDPAGARPVLERALDDKDWAVRVRAAELLGGDAAPRRPAPAPAVPALADVDRFIAPAVTPVAYLDTTRGEVQIELAVLDAPRTVASFIELARKRFFNGLPLHRVVPNFVVQDGDPRGDGEGGPGYTLRDEINQRPYLRGTVGMALDWADTGGSQFFITLAPQPHLDGRYTVFGQVSQGLDVLDRLRAGDVIRSIRVWDGVSWIGDQ
ncbi:MAG: HEAT repeat domain-containing protein [Acidobacteriota bacterium]